MPHGSRNRRLSHHCKYFNLKRSNITFTDGSQQTITSDESWKTSDGPLMFGDMRRGAIYDARRDITGWSKASFHDAK